MAAEKSKDIQVLLVSDSATIVLKAEKTPHIRVTASSMRDAAVVLPGEQLVVRWEHGKVRVARQAGPPVETPQASLEDAGY